MCTVSVVPNSQPQLTLPFSGKQWHEPKTAFRPKVGNASYAKRVEQEKAVAAIKAKEKEMKDEKEAERQVRLPRAFEGPVTLTLHVSEVDTGRQRQARSKGGEGAVREDGREDAPQEGRTGKSKGEAEQDVEVLKAITLLERDAVRKQPGLFNACRKGSRGSYASWDG